MIFASGATWRTNRAASSASGARLVMLAVMATMSGFSRRTIRSRSNHVRGKAVASTNRTSWSLRMQAARARSPGLAAHSFSGGWMTCGGSTSRTFKRGRPFVRKMKHRRRSDSRMFRPTPCCKILVHFHSQSASASSDCLWARSRLAREFHPTAPRELAAPLPFQEQAGAVTFVVPAVNIYEITQIALK